MKSADWACWSFWILFSIFDLTIGALLPEAELSGSSLRSLHMVSWALVFDRSGSGALLDALA